MSFWITITLTRDFEDRDNLEGDRDKLHEKVLEYVKENGRGGHSYITHGGNIFVKPRNIKPENLLEELIDYWSRAVVISAEDTGDMGTAELYVRSGEYELKPRVRDRYEESQRDNTADTGRRAAAYMMFAHGIDAQADYKNHWKHSERTVGFEEQEEVEE